MVFQRILPLALLPLNFAPTAGPVAPLIHEPPVVFLHSQVFKELGVKFVSLFPALSRSLFSRMIPVGQEAEYFSLYEVSERGTSWLGPLFFGLALQFTGEFGGLESRDAARDAQHDVSVGEFHGACISQRGRAGAPASCAARVRRMNHVI